MTFVVEVCTSNGQVRWLGRRGLTVKRARARHFRTAHIAEVVAADCGRLAHLPIRVVAVVVTAPWAVAA